MCGLAGFLTTQSHPDLHDAVRAMNDAIRHRGPDSSGEWCDAQQGVALGHRRLAIVDISPAGHQPMVSASGRFVLVFNGEVYNHQDLRAELMSEKAAPAWRGHSDTETMLAAFEAWGLEASLKRFVGMYAFALWDQCDKTLTLARDRIGEKPMYYGWQQGVLLFGSELKALRVHRAFRAVIDRQSVARFLRYSYVPAPASIYEGICKLPAASYVVFKRDGLMPGVMPASQRYWDVRRVLHDTLEKPAPTDANGLIDELENRLRHSIAEQMIADVPLGALLSGGVDSSAVVALMQAQSAKPVHTYCIGFHEKAFNEAEFAKRIAQHLGTRHTELYLAPERALQVIPQLPTLFDEPVGDYSAIPQYLVSQMTRAHVTVALTGDGGDELFCGYDRYVRAMKLWTSFGSLPPGLRRIAAGLLRGLQPMTLALRGISPRLTDYTQRMADVLPLPDQDALYDNLISHWRPPVTAVIGQRPLTSLFEEAVPQSLRERLSPWQRMALNDLLHFLPDHVLAKGDRAAMAVGLETRAPFLDHRIVEFAMGVPQQFKLREGSRKWLLKQVLLRHVPRDLVERPKMGFTVPVSAWLRGPLAEWAHDLLNEKSLQADGLFESAPILEKWREHREGKRDWGQSLWNVLMILQWLRAAKDH